MQQVLYTLAALASDDDLYAIASADQKVEALTSFVALKQVIDLQDGILTEDQSDVPGRALRHASEQTGTAGLVPATALVLMNAHHDPGLRRVVERLWALHHKTLHALPKRLSRPLMMGFRHLYETDPSWEPFGGQLFPISQSSEIILPVIPTED